MIAGQSAGVAAALAIEAHRQIHEIDLAVLQQTLRRETQILSLGDVQTRP